MTPLTAPLRLTTAILLNAFVFPGSGHFFVGMKKRGYLISGLTLLFLILPIARYTMSAVQALQRLPFNANGLARSTAAIEQAWMSDRHFLLLCFLILGILWVYGMVDLLVAKEKHRSTMSTGKPAGGPHG